MKLIFAGTPSFAATALKSLFDTPHEIALVLTQPDRPAGRLMQNQISAVKALANKYNIPLAQPLSLKDNNVQALLLSQKPDLMVVAAYGLLLPKEVLAIPKYGCINIHASLLPRWRGAAPIQRAIEAGDKKTGITIMKVDCGLDTGDILLQESLPIFFDDTAETLTSKLATLGATLLIEAIHNLLKITPRAQSEKGLCYANKITKAEAKIDWEEDGTTIVRKIHAFNPNPGAFTSFNGSLIKVWRAKTINLNTCRPYGTIVELTKTSIVVAARNQSVALTLLQSAGGKKMTAEAFINGHQLGVGQALGLDLLINQS